MNRGELDSQPQDVLLLARGENFPVAPWFLPRDQRSDLRALYAYARLVDDLGDEARSDRLQLLALIEADLERVWNAAPHYPVLRALVPVVRRRHLQPDPFRRLIQANRWDQGVVRCPTYDDLLAYCALSANPVGELVLAVFGASTPERVARSNDICTALQLIEHCQDVAEDLTANRVYLPEEDLHRFGCQVADLGVGPPSPRVQELMTFEVDRAATLLERGRPLVATLSGPSQWATAGFVAGGRAAVGALRRGGYDVVTRHPRPGKRRLLSEFVRVLGLPVTVAVRRQLGFS